MFSFLVYLIVIGVEKLALTKSGLVYLEMYSRFGRTNRFSQMMSGVLKSPFGRNSGDGQ